MKYEKITHKFDLILRQLVFYIPVLIFLMKNEVEVNIYSFKSRVKVLHLAGF